MNQVTKKNAEPRSSDQGGVQRLHQVIKINRWCHGALRCIDHWILIIKPGLIEWGPRHNLYLLTSSAFNSCITDDVCL